MWRYAGHLMGIPESILYTDGAEAESIYTAGFMCEPPPDEDSVEMAHAPIESIPAVAGITDPAEKRKNDGTGLPAFAHAHRKHARRAVPVSMEPYGWRAVFV